MDRTRDNFADLLKPHLKRLYRLAFRLTGSKSDAEDLLQDVLIKLFQRRAELSSITDLEPWLSRVLYNQFVDESRRFARKRFTLVDPSDLDAGGSADDCEEHRPERLAEAAFNIKNINAALAALSLEHRSVLLMHDAEGYKLEEIQTITGVPIGTLKSRLHRARARLRALLEADGTF